MAALLPVASARAQAPPEDVTVTVPEDDPIVEQTFDTETLLPAETETTMAVEIQDTCCGFVFSGDGQVLAGSGTPDQDAAAPGDSFTVQIDAPADGSYAVGADLSRGADFGIHALSVNGAQVGEPVDAYAETSTLDRRVSYGATALTAGPNTFTFTVTGQNPAAGGYLIGLDLLRLLRVPDDGLALSPADGDSVRQTVPVVGYSTAETATSTLAIDGAPVASRAAIGGETASLVFRNDGGNGLQSGFRNLLRVRGQEIVVPDVVTETNTAWADIPGELLGPGANQVAFVTGPRPGDCNRDDFTIADVRLELPDGTIVADPEIGSGSVSLGDGICGSSDKPREYTFAFEIPEDADLNSAAAYEWDTTAVEDGEHTITLGVEQQPGATRTHTVYVDNTAPVIVATTPSAGVLLKGDFTVTAEVADAAPGEVTTTVTLDGQPVELDAELSSDDLTDGPHTFVFTATDEAGNTTSTTVDAASVRERPDTPQLVAPADNATGLATDVPLQVQVSDPAGDALAVTFLPASGSTPTAGAGSVGSTTTQPPSELDPEGGTPLDDDDADAASATDDVATAPVESDEFPYQRFDVAVQASDAERSSVDVTWEGRVDSARAVVLSAWDLQQQAWVELDRGRGADEGDLRLSGPVDLASTRDGDIVHVLVQGTDPFADDVADAPDEQFRDPDTYDFSLAWMTDTQYLSEGAADESLPDSARFAAAYSEINEWIVDNAEGRKIAYTAHTGDIIENWVSPNNDEDQARREFEFASDTMDILEDAGMPYGVTPGNHDNQYGLSNELYNEYFPPERFREASDDASQEYYGGPWREGDNQNHFDLFEAGGQEFIVVYLGMIAGQEEIDWANQVLAEHRERKAIFATHEYLLPTDNADGRNGELADESDTSQGREFFEQVVLPNENVFLTLSGHTHGVALNIRRNQGPQGRTVVEMLANYQFYEVGGDRRTGFFRLLQFDLDRSEMSVNTYSPVLNNHNAEEFDTRDTRNYTPEADEFTVPVDLTSRTTSFSTNLLRLEERLDDPIGTAAVDGGGEAATTWNGLAPDSDYLWYARAEDDFGGSAESDVFTFSTGGPTEPGDDTTVRLGGANRIETAIEISRNSIEDGQAGAVVLSRADDFPDALAGTPLAIAEDGPLLLTQPEGLSRDTRAELRRVLPKGGTVFLLGGRLALSDRVAQQVESLGFAIVRFGGPNRFATASLVARRGLGSPSTVVLADGRTFADAIAAGAGAGQAGGAVLLTQDDAVPAETQAYLDANDDAQLFAAGGPAARAVPGATPLVGADRIQTSIAVAQEFFDAPPVVGIATGAAFPDALAGGAAAGRAGGPLLLTYGEALDENVENYLTANASSTDRALIFGSTAALSDTVRDQVGAAIRE